MESLGQSLGLFSVPGMGCWERPSCWNPICEDRLERFPKETWVAGRAEGTGMMLKPIVSPAAALPYSRSPMLTAGFPDLAIVPCLPTRHSFQAAGWIILIASSCFNHKLRQLGHGTGHFLLPQPKGASRGQENRLFLTTHPGEFYPECDILMKASSAEDIFSAHKDRTSATLLW